MLTHGGSVQTGFFSDGTADAISAGAIRGEGLVGPETRVIPMDFTAACSRMAARSKPGFFSDRNGGSYLSACYPGYALLVRKRA